MAEFVSLRRFIGEHFEQQNVARCQRYGCERNLEMPWAVDRMALKTQQKKESYAPVFQKNMLRFGLLGRFLGVQIPPQKVTL